METLIFILEWVLVLCIGWGLLGLVGYAMIKLLLMSVTPYEWMMYRSHITNLTTAPEYALIVAGIILGPCAILVAAIIFMGRMSE